MLTSAFSPSLQFHVYARADISNPRFDFLPQLLSGPQVVPIVYSNFSTGWRYFFHFKAEGLRKMAIEK